MNNQVQDQEEPYQFCREEEQRRIDEEKRGCVPERGTHPAKARTSEVRFTVEILLCEALSTVMVMVTVMARRAYINTALFRRSLLIFCGPADLQPDEKGGQRTPAPFPGSHQHLLISLAHPGGYQCGLLRQFAVADPRLDPLVIVEIHADRNQPLTTSLTDLQLLGETA